MLTLRRYPDLGRATDRSTIDIEYKEESVTLTLVDIYIKGIGCTSVWKIISTDWGNEKYTPKSIALMTNQPLTINDWLKVYGSEPTNKGEAIIHLSAPKEAIINRRDRLNND